MILTDWAKVLCDLEDDERKAAMLMLADELSEDGGTLLRNLTCNIAGFCIKPRKYDIEGSIHSVAWIDENHVKDWKDTDTKRWMTFYIQAKRALIPNLIIVKLTKSVKSSLQRSYFCTQKEAWEDLLDVLSKM